MDKIYTKEQLDQFEKAIDFLVNQVQNFCRNEKPVILHSIRVGVRLLDNREDQTIIIVGFLHDLIEDTNCRIEEIQDRFGKEAADLVQVLTFDRTITDYKERWNKEVPKIIKAGRKAMIIKVADSMDNLPYYILIPDDKKREEVLWKHNLIVNSFEKYLGQEKIFQEYKKAVQQITKTFSKAVK